MSNKIEQIIEDVEEKDLVIESEVEVSEETEVTEQEQPLSNAVLDVLLGEAKKKNEEEEDSDEEDESEDEDEELEEATEEDEEDSEEDEEEVSEAADDEDSEEDEEEVSEAADEESDEEESEEEESEEDEDSEDEVELPEVKTKAGILAASFDALKGMKKSNLVAAYEAINMSEDEGEVPKTKADIINAMYGQLKAMKKENLQASFKSIVSSCGVHEETEADSFAEDLKVLAEADKDLTEDFKAKASVLFEAAIADKVNGIQESLEAQYAEDLSEEVAYVNQNYPKRSTVWKHNMLKIFPKKSLTSVSHL